MRSTHALFRPLAAIVLTLAAAPLVAAAPIDLDAPGRTRQDRDRDAYNHPEALFAFWGLHDGMRIMDLYPGDGYTTLLLSQLVGPAGKVLAYDSYDHEAFEKRMKPLALGNVEETAAAEPECFKTIPTTLASIPAGSLDAVVTIRNYHDIAEPARALVELKRILKPGGILGIVDSRTAAGRDDKTHRIADDVIIREVTAAGFTLAGVSQMLSNPRDDAAKGFWEERFIVDQSCLKFTK
ncbi:MAG: class I SAM-dependent methyltransferase [Acidobacteria bacterium]|nr:class I SAM-dependent methyltransferase [Acidobacteriota bacterium]